MSTKTDWPESVPVFKAADIAKGVWSNDDGQHCAVGWGMNLFRADAYVDFANELRSQIGCHEIIRWNDAKGRTTAEIARVLNRVMRRLGYTEVYEVK